MEEKDVIKKILELSKILEKYKGYEIIASSIEFCIKEIPENSIQLAKTIRENNVIASFIDAVIKHKDNKNNEYLS